jgi:AcrR family transcriptional regulator
MGYSHSIMGQLVNHEISQESGRRERRRAETQQRILNAAIQLFSTRGFLETTVEEITEAADVGKGTFFNYFPTKDALLVAIFEQVGQQFAQLRASVPATHDVRAALTEFAHGLLRMIVRAPKIVRGFVGLALTDPMVGERFHGVMMQARQTVVAMLDHGQQLGQVRTDIPAKVLGRTLQQFIFGTEIVWSFSSGEDLHEWIDVTLELFWTGASVTPEPEAQSPARRDV